MRSVVQDALTRFHRRELELSSRLARRSRIVAALAVACLAPFIATMPAHADPNNNSVKKLTKAVTLDGVMRHMQAFQGIADANGDRAAGRPGSKASADYIAGKVRSAGYDVSVQEFTFDYTEATFEQVSPTATRYGNFAVNQFTPLATGTTTAPLQRVGAGDATPGCEAADFAGFTAGNVALIQRGGCAFTQKSLNAKAAGATGVVIFDNVTGPLVGMIGEAPGLGIPAIFTTLAQGTAIAAALPMTVRLNVIAEPRQTWNVLAQTKEGRTDNVVMAGAHYDGAQDGRGMNDNGSGAAALLETAIQMAKVKPNNAVRFAWWGAEEEGLLGARDYVAKLSQADQDKIALYLNFDMIGSANYMFGIYDGDNSGGTAAPGTIPPGSAEIEDQFEKFYADRGERFNDTAFDGRSDYGPFIAVGIPAGGLFTGAEGDKTPAQQQMYGGLAGVDYDPCYHQRCDSLNAVADGADAALYAQLGALYDLRGNINAKAIDVNSDAIAASVITYAFDTSAVNGVRVPGKSHGKANPTGFGEQKEAPAAG